ncbi:MAG: alpha/beta fold hydrolase [Holophagaceae bacterium]
MPRRVLLLCLSFLCLQAGPLHFQKAGQGPGVLLIHGFGGNKEVWAGVAAELAQDHTVLSVDLPGSGGTPGPAVVEGRADFGALAKDLAALVRKEGLAPCLVVGHSMGGPIAARTVLVDAGAFRGLILVDSFLSALPAAFMEPTISGLESNAPAALSAFMSHVSAGPTQNQRVVAEALRVPIAALQAYLRALTRDPIDGRQAQLRLPVLQLAAGRREADPAREAAALAQFGFKGLPAFRAIHFPRARHWIMWDAPESFLVALRAFEAGLGR